MTKLVVQRPGAAAWIALAVLATLPVPATAQERVDVHAPSAAPAGSRLSLEEAIRLSLRAAPSTAVTIARREALAAARAAAGLKPQPSVELSVENFGIPIGDLYDQFQVTGTYSQPIERGNKRAARVGMVEREVDIAEAEAIVARLELIRLVQQGFVEVQAAEAAITIARERLRVAQELEREVGRRVASAKDPVFAGTRARTGVSEARVDLDLAIHARDAALARLTALWGSSDQYAGVEQSDFLDLRRVDLLGPSPADLAIVQARIARAEAAVAVQRANATRDITVSAGPRIIGSGAVGAVAGVSLPLGGRRLAQARVAEAQAESRRVAAELAVERFRLERAIALAAERVEESRREAELLQGEVLPSAQRTLEQVRFGYNRGFFSFADVSAAQLTLTNARSRVIAAARRYHEARVELDRLTGRFTELAREAA